MPNTSPSIDFSKIKIVDIMTTRLVCIAMDDNLEAVKNIFDNVRFHHLLVVEDELLVGVVSDRDLLKSISYKVDTAAETSRDSASLNKRVHQIMTRELICLNQQSTLADAIKLFGKHTISCLPVVDQMGKPIGIVSWRDLIKEFV